MTDAVCKNRSAFKVYVIQKTLFLVKQCDPSLTKKNKNKNKLLIV